MSFNRCPHCNNPLTADERKLRNCPACGKPLAVGVAAEPGLMRESGGVISRGPLIAGVSSAPGWGTMRAALAIFGLGWFLVQANIVTVFILRENLRGDIPSVLEILITLLALAAVIGSIYFLTGICMSCAVPGESGAKPWGIGAAFCLFVSLVVFMLLMAADLTNRRAQHPNDRWNPETIKILGYTFAGGIFLAKILFTGCLWGIARHFLKTGLSITLFLFLLLELAGVITLFVYFVKDVPLGNPGAGTVISAPIDMLYSKKWYSIGISSGLCVLFLIQVLMVRATITRAMSRPV
jgi:hypothetical protein